MSFWDGFEKRALSLKKYKDLIEGGIRSRAGHAEAAAFRTSSDAVAKAMGATPDLLKNTHYLDAPKPIRSVLKDQAKEVSDMFPKAKKTEKVVH